MSYKIGQFRRDMLSQYLTRVDLIQGDRITEASSIEKIYFKDVKFNINNSSRSFFDREKSYYIKIKIQRPETIQDTNRNSNQEFLLFLENDNSENEKTSQFLKNFYVPSINTLNEEKYITLELVFNPSLIFTSLVLQMKRTGEDYLTVIDASQYLYGRTVIIESVECYTINNILNKIAEDNNQSSVEFVKLGVQGPSGLLMCINGQEIRVWPNGIYQIKNGYKVNFLGFIITDEEESSFILDYQY